VFAQRRHDPGVLVAEVAALGEAAHVEDPAAVREVQVGSGAPDDRRRIPLRLHTPAVQHGIALGRHGIARRAHGSRRAIADSCTDI
jgi:hypothetical protein